MGWSTYRREAGLAGKDTRGIIRVHQFNKAEMFSFCRPKMKKSTHASLRGKRCSLRSSCPIGSTRPPVTWALAARKFDCEAWLPTRALLRSLDLELHDFPGTSLGYS